MALVNKGGGGGVDTLRRRKSRGIVNENWMKTEGTLRTLRNVIFAGNNVGDIVITNFV